MRSFNRRTLDPLNARVYFYLQVFHEQLGPKPPSRQSPVHNVREPLLTALRSAILRKDQETQAATIVLLLRNYVSTADITEADLLVAHNQFPLTASNNNVARYLYYLGRIRKDGTYTLARRLHQNVIRTGVRMLSLAYSRIPLRDICIRLGIESEQSAEYIVAKAIRDGVIDASINHEKGYMETKRAGDVYATREPAEAFHERIQACLGLHDECVRAMRFPMNQHKLELKSAQEARERERELAKEIQDGDIDEDDAGGEFDGL